MPPKDAFSNRVGNIRGLLHSSIPDIDALLRSSPEEDEVTDPDTFARLAEKEADFEEGLARIDRLEGQLTYSQDDSKTNKKAFDNPKLQHQNLKAEDRTRKTEWVAKEDAYKSEIAGLAERLSGNEWGIKEAGYKQQIAQFEENWKDGHARFTELERVHRRCKTSAGERVRNVNETLENQHKAEVGKVQRRLDQCQNELKISRDANVLLGKEHLKCDNRAKGEANDRSGRIMSSVD